jgi:tetratricopeptide (TPR) repeat protein
MLPEQPRPTKGDAMMVRCNHLKPGQTLAARLVEAPSFLSRDSTRTVLEVYVGSAPIQLEPPFAMGTEVVEATPEEWDRLREASFDLPQAALAPSPPDAGNHYDRGKALFAEGRLAEAEREFSHAIALDPQDARFYYSRGYVYSVQIKQMGWVLVETDDGRRVATLGDPRLPAALDLAIADYTSAIERDPEMAPAFGMRAEMYSMKGLRELSVGDLRQAAALGDEGAKQRLKERFGIG